MAAPAQTGDLLAHAADRGDDEQHNVSRERQDEYGCRQLRAAAAEAAGKFKDEIVPITVKMKVVDKTTGAETVKEVTSSRTRTSARTRPTRLSQIKPAIKAG